MAIRVKLAIISLGSSQDKFKTFISNLITLLTQLIKLLVAESSVPT